VFGGSGSGQSTAANAFASDEPVSFRLQWLGWPTLQNRSDVGPTGSEYNIGGSVSFTLQGQPGQLWVLAGGDSFLSPAVTIPGIFGPFRVNGAVLFTAGLLDAFGEGGAILNVPNSPGLVGLYLVYQGAIVDPATGSIVMTNGTDHFINS
jgi:hypothetical protein